MKILSLNDSFTFKCGSERRCFNECCRDLNQFLTPYDILRLRAHLGVTTGEFLSRHASEHTGPETGLPIITLRTDFRNGELLLKTLHRAFIERRS